MERIFEEADKLKYKGDIQFVEFDTDEANKYFHYFCGGKQGCYFLFRHLSQRCRQGGRKCSFCETFNFKKVTCQATTSAMPSQNWYHDFTNSIKTLMGKVISLLMSELMTEYKI